MSVVDGRRRPSTPSKDETVSSVVVLTPSWTDGTTERSASVYDGWFGRGQRARVRQTPFQHTSSTVGKKESSLDSMRTVWLRLRGDNWVVCEIGNAGSAQ